MTVLDKIDTVIIHIPKTGGSSVRWPAINKFGVKYSCQHCNYTSLPEIYKDYRKIAFIRHPHNWYASRFFFDEKKYKNNSVKKEPFSDALSHRYQRTFEETLPLYLDLTEAFKDKRTLELFKKMVTVEVTNNYQCWWVSYFDDISSLKAEDFEHKSLYQWFCDIQGLGECDEVYRLEDEYETGMMSEFGNDVNLVHRNKTGRKSNEEIFTQDMKKMIDEKEMGFMKKYGY